MPIKRDMVPKKLPQSYIILVYTNNNNDNKNFCSLSYKGNQVRNLSQLSPRLVSKAKNSLGKYMKNN